MRWPKRFYTVYAVPLIAATFVLATTPGPAHADTEDVTREELLALEEERASLEAQLQALQEAEDIVARDLGALEADLISAAMDSRRREEEATASELRLISLGTEISSAKRALIEDESALEGIIASLAVSGRHRPPALVTKPRDVNAAIRAAILMGDAAPRLNAKADTLREEIEQLRRYERQVRREQARLRSAEAALELRQAEITRMTAAKRAVFEDVSGDAEQLRDRVTLIARETETIRALLAALENAAPPAPALKPRLRYASLPNRATDVPTVPRARLELQPLGEASLGRLGRPAAGRLVRGWGDAMPGGTKSEGLAIETRSEAQITAPIDGKIEFAGPFRTYGELLIISTSDGYHVLLSGMAASYVTVGQSVRRGEPVARMANRVTPAPELYMEVRQAGQPMNPANWMDRG